MMEDAIQPLEIAAVQTASLDSPVIQTVMSLVGIIIHKYRISSSYQLIRCHINPCLLRNAKYMYTHHCSIAHMARDILASGMMLYGHNKDCISLPFNQ